ncbi:MAG: hypothetical protein B6242_11425 [Anaerolineaceae bacterium 4572_78]|nr:MAG: hypothetical protein B6242_11425 [Anaerolineaceae bacterium 4572_78]
MESITISLSLPQALIFDCGLSQKEMQQFIKRIFIIALYCQDRISSGKAANLLGIHRMTFIRMLADEGIAYVDYTIDELKSEIAGIEQWNQV